MTTQQSRRHRQKWGRWAETLAVAALRLKGYWILRRNFRVPVGEIDIIACRRATVVFIEVKARPDWVDAMAVVSERQWWRIARAAEWFVMRHSEFAGFDWRFDIVAVQPWCWPRHLPEAWRPAN